MRPFLTVLIPAYNEGPRITQAIRGTAEYLRRQPYTWELLVVDDGSRDDTAQRVAAEQGPCPQLRWVRHETNQGKGAAVRTGLGAAAGENVLFCDADGATPIRELERFLPPLRNGADLVAGSRRMAGSRIHAHQRRLRRFLSTGYRWLCRLLISPGISDTTCGFKLLSRRACELFPTRMSVRAWSFDAELFAIARAHRLKVVQVPVEWTDQGKTKVRLKQDMVGSFLELLQIVARSAAGRYR